jgi:hypothetical protein
MGIFTAIVILSAFEAMAANYYLSAGGNDAVAQPTAQQPWKSISKVNGLNLEPGDSVLFKGGDTLSGTITIGSDDNGTAASPVVFGSFGSGHAVIKSTGNGVDAGNCRYIRVVRLDFVGPTRLSGGQRGVFFNGVRNSVIDSVRSQGYNRSGIGVDNSQAIRVTGCYVTDNGYAGILAMGTTRDLYIGYCKAINNPGYPTSPNHSGNGILLQGGTVRQCLIEYCEAAENGWDMGNPNGGNGPCGIWTWCADSVLIQYCIAHHNRSTPKHGDGCGFDWDGGTNNTTIQYCYSYENDGNGYFFCEQSGRSSTNNIMRYCISENDGNLSWTSGISIAGTFTNCKIYNNIVYSTAMPKGVPNHFGVVQTRNYYGAPLESSCAVFGAGMDEKNAVLYNNIFILKGSGRIVGSYNGDPFRNNLYWCIGGSATYAGNTQGGFAAYPSLDTWRDATGNEKINGQNVGMYADPMLANAGKGEKLTDPTQLPKLFAYMLLPTSPCIDKGLDLHTLGINPGTRDFYGRTIPYNGAFDIGACEYDGSPVEVARRFLDLKNGADLNGGMTRKALIIGGMAANLPLFPATRLFDCAGKIRERVHPVPAIMVTAPSVR